MDCARDLSRVTLAEKAMLSVATEIAETHTHAHTHTHAQAHTHTHTRKHTHTPCSLKRSHS